MREAAQGPKRSADPFGRPREAEILPCVAVKRLNRRSVFRCPVWKQRSIACLGFFVLSALVSLGADTVVFGPRTYTRGTGRPVAVRNTLNVPRPFGTYVL